MNSFAVLASLLAAGCLLAALGWPGLDQIRSWAATLAAQGDSREETMPTNPPRQRQHDEESAPAGQPQPAAEATDAPCTDHLFSADYDPGDRAEVCGLVGTVITCPRCGEGVVFDPDDLQSAKVAAAAAADTAADLAEKPGARATLATPLAWLVDVDGAASVLVEGVAHVELRPNVLAAALDNPDGWEFVPVRWAVERRITEAGRRVLDMLRGLA